MDEIIFKQKFATLQQGKRARGLTHEKWIGIQGLVTGLDNNCL
jgi:hypothetical protein